LLNDVQKKLVESYAYSALDSVWEKREKEVRIGLSATMGSFVPRPFLLPVFDHFQYANMERKAWESWSHAVRSGRQRVDTWGR